MSSRSCSSSDFNFDDFISSLQGTNEPKSFPQPSTESVKVMDELLKELRKPDVVMIEGKLRS